MPPFYFLTFAKVSVSVSKKFGLKKVSVSVSKTFGLEKKSRYRSRKHLVSKKSLGIGLENIWSRKKVSVSVSKILVSKKSLGIGLDEIFWSRHSVILMLLVLSLLFDVLRCLLSFFPLHSLFQVFKSRFLRGLESQLIYYFYVLGSIFQLGPDLYFSRCSRMRISHVFPSGGNFNTLLPGRHQGDAEVQR